MKGTRTTEWMPASQKRGIGSTIPGSEKIATGIDSCICSTRTSEKQPAQAAITKVRLPPAGTSAEMVSPGVRTMGVCSERGAEPAVCVLHGTGPIRASDKRLDTDAKNSRTRPVGKHENRNTH